MVYLFEIFVLHRNIVKSNHHDREPVVVWVRQWGSSIRIQLSFSSRRVVSCPGYKLVLDQQKGLHGMMQGKFVLSHL